MKRNWKGLRDQKKKGLNDLSLFSGAKLGSNCFSLIKLSVSELRQAGEKRLSVIVLWSGFTGVIQEEMSFLPISFTFSAGASRRTRLFQMLEMPAARSSHAPFVCPWRVFQGSEKLSKYTNSSFPSAWSYIEGASNSWWCSACLEDLWAGQIFYTCSTSMWVCCWTFKGQP